MSRADPESAREALDGILEHLENAELDERARRGGHVEPHERMFIQREPRARYLAAARDLAAALPPSLSERMLAILSTLDSPDADLGLAMREVEALLQATETPRRTSRGSDA